MKRSAAIAMMWFQPGVLFLALVVSCAFMPQCQTHECCDEEQTAVSGPCCAAFAGGPSTATLHSAQFTLDAPGEMTSPAPFAQPATTAAMTPVFATPLDSSPPILTLRI